MDTFFTYFFQERKPYPPMTQLTINAQSLLDGVPYRPSPHQDARPEGASIDTIIVHNISLPPAEFGGGHIDAFFCGELDVGLHPYFDTIKHLRVSAHLLIKRDGELVQFVPFVARAWHAGQSFFDGKTHCNDFSIGIELEGADTIPYAKIQYQRLTQVIKLLQSHYPAITAARIVGHADVAPGRKTDPGPAFDWAYLKEQLGL